ncbi:HAAS signaling domain-containing protein [Saccharopolyspora sp. NPDC002376]
MTYLADLEARLRENGVPAARVATTVDELTDHLAETGVDPVAEFGPVEEFAAQLTGSDGAAPEPAREATTWRCIADIFVDRELLARYGAQGWEMTRIDTTGHFVCQRDPEHPQRWEYLRETVGLSGVSKAERLAPDGWEQCGSWPPFAYFKRPAAASVGELSAPPEPPQRQALSASGSGC